MASTTLAEHHQAAVTSAPATTAAKITLAGPPPTAKPMARATAATTPPKSAATAAERRLLATACSTKDRMIGVGCRPAPAYGLPVRRWVVAVLLLVATACGGDDDEAATTTTSAAPSATTTEAPTSTTEDRAGPGFGGATTATSTPGVGPAFLTAVRVARQDGFDRVVFEFDGGPPGSRVEYVARPITEDGSGEEVTVEGAAVLQVRMEQAASARLSGENVLLTYTGPKRLRPPGTATVVELVQTGDFEAVLTWVVGTRQRAPFKVTTLRGPLRLVVDVAHPAA